MIQINNNIVTMTKEDLLELQGEVTSREIIIDQIETIVNKRLDEAVGRFDWYKSVDGKLFLEIQKIIGGEK
jgi:hypothetical protein